MFPLPIFKGKAFEKGKFAEDFAAKYLKRSGYKIITRNYRKPYGEIDIICKKDSCLVFVEVRSLSGDFMEPSETITYRKKENLSKVIKAFISENGWEGDVRFDFIGLRWNGNDFEINHIENFLDF
ncbi:MAG: YraN family protein [candidate division WOR-3 bacterium]